ncbi:MAG: toll/interleukin-1 receptor domain-containing protein, partial [Sphingomonadales bacterium]|nr:toll/interleukin-1 receptor domain-containing protein [Sphingomonadales bacterium]
MGISPFEFRAGRLPSVVDCVIFPEGNHRGTMVVDGATPGTPRYRAFISYSHADATFARWLHRRLERYSLPPAQGAEETGRLSPVFLDRAELAAGPDLSSQVREALGGSGALIVVASPAARASRWVNQEIELFRSLHPDRPILAALIAGEPEQAFPEPLVLHEGRAVEPLAADFRKDGDGRRLGLIKIVAGLTGLPLDRLVQRDAQSRQRRVMAVTAGAVALSVVLATLLVLAMRERAEAQRQRADAEGMVEFMLTDLRDRLKGVGRLEIMDSVNRKAMEHYTTDRDLSALPDDMLQRRARLLTAMGEDDNAAGKTADAEQEFAAAYRVTADLMRREPDNPERIFNHAQSEYWVGFLPFQIGQKAAAQPHWNAYLTLAKRLVALQPHEIRWQREVGYAEANLCALALARPVEVDAARAHCSAAVAVTGAIAQSQPDDMQSQLDYAENIAWQADAARKGGRGAEAVALRLKQKALVESLAARFAGDTRVDQARLQAGIGLAQTYAALDQPAMARAAAEQTLATANMLQGRDPANKHWQGWRDKLT